MECQTTLSIDTNVPVLCLCRDLCMKSNKTTERRASNNKHLHSKTQEGWGPPFWIICTKSLCTFAPLNQLTERPFISVFHGTSHSWKPTSHWYQVKGNNPAIWQTFLEEKSLQLPTYLPFDSCLLTCLASTWEDVLRGLSRLLKQRGTKAGKQRDADGGGRSQCSVREGKEKGKTWMKIGQHYPYLL